MMGGGALGSVFLIIAFQLIQRPCLWTHNREHDYATQLEDLKCNIVLLLGIYLELRSGSYLF
jgi:hypothetical protein